MASSVSKTIEIIFAGVDNLSGTLSTIGSNVEGFGDGLADIGAPFADATKTVLALDAAIIGLGVAALKASADIDSETRKMANSLGLPTLEAEKFAEVAKQAYTGGFGESLSDAFAVATLAQQKFGDNAEVDIGKVTKNALILQETFGTEYQQSLGAVSSLMKNFGLTSTEAFDFIASGFQKGLDGSGDFLESITEYGVQFKDGGANAGQFFSLLETGFAEGVSGTDKAADAFKEFGIKIREGAKPVNEALAAIGLDPDALRKNLSNGTTSVADAFTLIQTTISNTTGKTEAFKAGVELIGSQFEDLGISATKSLDLTKTKIGDLQGTIDNFKVDDLGVAFTTLYRTISLGISDSSLWDGAKVKLAKIFGDIAKSFGIAFDDVDFSELVSSAETIWNQIGNIFKSNELDLTTVEGMKNAIQLVVDSIESLADVTSGIIEIFTPMIEGAIDAAKWFNALDDESKILAGNILALGSALTVVGGIVAVGGKLIGGISSFISLAKTMGTTVSGIGPFFTGLAAKAGGLATAIAGSTAGALALAAGTGVAVGSLARLIPGVDEAAEGLFEMTDKLFNWTGTQQEASDNSADLTMAMYRIKRAAIDGAEGVDDATESVNELNKALMDPLSLDFDPGKVTSEINKIYNEIDTLSTILKLKPDLDQNSQNEIFKQIDELKFKAVDLEESLNINANLRIDASQVEDLENAIPEDQEIRVWTNADIESARKAEKDLKEVIPEKQDVELKAKLDKEAADRELDVLKLRAQGISDAFEYKAKVDVAEIEAAAQMTQAAFSSIGEGLASSASVLGSFSSIYTDTETAAERLFVERQITQEGERRDRELKLQKELIERQIAYYDAKREAAEAGDPLIQVDGSGLQPHLEAIMWEILAAIQVRANEEGQAALIGLTV